jgi:sigma-E factor negative regulatory protein RseC
VSSIKHIAEVIRIEGDTLYVRMMVNSACSGCHAKAVCGASESAEKIVEVDVASGADFTLGEQVEVALLDNNMGTRSVILAYVVPFVVLSVMLIGALLVGFGEGLAVLAAMAGVAAYYAVLWTLRERLKNKIKFIIIKQTK